MASRRRTTTRITVSAERGVFMISVDAELAEAFNGDDLRAELLRKAGVS